MINSQDIKKGVAVRMDGGIWVCIDFQHRKPGKGNTIMNIKLKNVTDGRVLERRYNIGEKLEDVSITRRPYQYLYKEGEDYNFMNQDAGRSIADVSCDHKSPETQALVEQYYTLVDTAKAITDDEAARYTAFAEAEAFLIEHAIVIPFSVSTEGYVATRLNVFEAQYAPYGLALQRFKYQHIMEKPMNMEQFNTLYAQWQTDRAAALEKAGQ